MPEEEEAAAVQNSSTPESRTSNMPDPTAAPDDFFTTEFGDGELSSRLWRGGLRANAGGYKLENSIYFLSTHLKDSLDARISDNTVTSIIDDIEACWNDPARMRRACSPLVISGPNVSTLSMSFVKLVLSIDLFQPAMMKCVINKISELGEDSCPDKDIAPMLLNQLRWLDFIVDGASLCENLLSIVPIVSICMQKAIIEALPEILDDSSRASAVTELVRILEDSPSMMGSVVDALGALGVEDERLPDVNSSILSTLGAVNRDILPVSLKYLLRTCPPILLTETVTALRNTLALPSLGAAPGRMCLDAVKAGLRMSKLVADHVVKTLRKLEQPSDHKPADLWLILALFESPLHKKPAEVVFRKKAANGIFSRTFLDAALTPFAAAFCGLTGRMIEMASTAIKSSEISARRTGVYLYALVFRVFDSGSTRRDVITATLNHTGTRKSSEIDAGLEALAMIGKEGEDDCSLMPHSASILGLLDFLEFFTDPQLRQIWTVLGFLCRASVSKGPGGNLNEGPGRRRSVNSVLELDLEDDDSGGSELSILQILLRKELTHSERFYRRIGVIGACTLIKVLGNHVKNNILAMLLEVGKSHPYNQAVAFDELAHVFCEGDPATKDTAESIRKTISAFFERTYISNRDNIGPLVKDESLLPAQDYGNLEGEDADVCFSISSLIRNEATLKESQDAVRAMIPSLRLLCVMTSSGYNGKLTEVDAIIGAPLHMPIFPADTNMDELNNRAKADLLLSLLIAHGWIVELINAFAEQSDSELRAKCLMRVDTLLEVSAQISCLVPQFPLWSEVLFDLYNGTRSGTRCGSSLHEASSSRGRAKKKKLKDTIAVRHGPRGSQEWKRYSRQLNSTALSLIRVTEPISFRLTETTSILREGAPSFETATLSPKALQYLLTELFTQVDELVGSDLKSDNALSTCVFRSSGSTTSAMRQKLLSESTTAGILKQFCALRTALTSVGAQLALCLKKILPAEELENDEDELSLEIYLSCMTLCLHILSRCLNSSILCDVLSQELLFSILSSVRLDGEASVQPSDPLTTSDIHAVAKVAFEQLHMRLGKSLLQSSTQNESAEDALRSTIIRFDGYVAFFAAMDSIFIHCSEKAQEVLGPAFSKTALAVLEISWDVGTLRSKKTHKLIPGIVRIYVQYGRDSISAAEDIRDKLVKLVEKRNELDKRAVDTQNASGQSQEDGLGSLTEQTSYPFTVAILEQYLWLFKCFQPRSFDRIEDAFGRMERLMQAELPLYNLARKNQRALGPVMRAGRTLVELFVKIFLPFLKDNFAQHRSSVIQLCKMHQKPTRALQTFCAHSKSVRDTSLTGLVPPLRKSLELLLYRVKDLLRAHNATEAFQLGNLKHRDINGEVLSSQHMQYKSESEKESEYSSGENTEDDTDEAERQEPRRLQSQTQERKRRSQLTSGQRKRLKSRQNTDDDTRMRTSGRVTPHRQRNVKRSTTHKMRRNGEDRMDCMTSSGTTGRRRRRNHVQDEEEEEGPGNPLIDDEAEENEDADSENNGVDDLSQFLVFDEEEEDEET